MRRSLLGLTALSLALGGCGGDGGLAGRSPEGGKLAVVASFYPVAEAASRAGGQRVELTNLTPAGTEPHDLELTPQQVDQIQDADLVLYLGGGFQPAVEKVARGRRGPSVDLLAELPLAEAEPEETPRAGDAAHEHGGADPHFWLDPTLMAQAVTLIEGALVGLDQAAAQEVGAAAEAYRQELLALDGELAEGLSDCRRREIVTSHAAFHYLARRYDLVQMPIAGLSPESEPDPRRLSELTDLIRTKNITTVFYETLVSPEVAETLAREAKVETAVLDPLEGLSDDEVASGGSYLSVMRRNLQALRQALDCA